MIRTFLDDVWTCGVGMALWRLIYAVERLLRRPSTPQPRIPWKHSTFNVDDRY